MGEFQCPVPGCEHERFQTLTAVKSHLRNKHPDSVPKAETREVPIVEEDFTTAELVRDKRMDIMRKASYDAYDKLVLRWLRVIATSF